MALVLDAMFRELVTVPPDASVASARDVADRAHVRHLLVIDENNLVGILCLCDLRGASARGSVFDLMTVPVLTVAPEASLEDAAETMRECDVGCLPVACGGLLLGTITDEELTRAGLRVSRRGGCHCRSGYQPERERARALHSPRA